MKPQTAKSTLALLVLATLLAGCATRRIPVDQPVPVGAESTPTPTPELAVRLCATTNLVADQLAQPDAAKNFGAFFVRVGSEAPLLQGLFDRTSPRVEFGTNNLFFKAGVVHDRVTGRPAMLLFVKKPLLAEGGDAATADGWHYVGPARGGGVRYQLERDATGWRIVARKPLSEF